MQAKKFEAGRNPFKNRSYIALGVVRALRQLSNATALLWNKAKSQEKCFEKIAKKGSWLKNLKCAAPNSPLGCASDRCQWVVVLVHL